MYTTSTLSLVHQETLQRVQFVTANTEMLKVGRGRMEVYRGEGSEERGRMGEAASSVSSEIGVAGSREPFSFTETES